MVLLRSGEKTHQPKKGYLHWNARYHPSKQRFYTWVFMWVTNGIFLSFNWCVRVRMFVCVCRWVLSPQKQFYSGWQHRKGDLGDDKVTCVCNAITHSADSVGRERRTRDREVPWKNLLLFRRVIFMASRAVWVRRSPVHIHCSPTLAVRVRQEKILRLLSKFGPIQSAVRCRTKSRFDPECLCWYPEHRTSFRGGVGETENCDSFFLSVLRSAPVCCLDTNK